MPRVAGSKLKPKATVKTVSEDSPSKSSSDKHHHVAISAHYEYCPKRERDQKLRIVESAPYLSTAYYPPPPSFIVMGGPNAPPQMVVHSGRNPCTSTAPYFLPPHVHQQVPYGYVFVPAFQQPQRFVVTNIQQQGMSCSENQPPVLLSHSNQACYPPARQYDSVSLTQESAPLVLPPRKTKTQGKNSALAIQVQPNVAPVPYKEKVVQAEPMKLAICAATMLLEAARVHEEREEARNEQVSGSDRTCQISTEPSEIQWAAGHFKPEKNAGAKTISRKATSKETKLQVRQSEQAAYSKHRWSTKEDDILRDAVTTMGAKRWAHIAKLLPGRLGKHCRNRWCQHLAPHVRKGYWGLEEDYAILKGHAKHGNRWSVIVRDLPGRTDNAVKNRFHASMKTKIEQYLEHRRGKRYAEVDSAGRYDYKDDIEGCLWMIHGVPNPKTFAIHSSDYCECVKIFAAKWKANQEPQQQQDVDSKKVAVEDPTAP